MRLALCQLRPRPGAPDANRARTVHAIQEAGEAGADLVVLPELCTTGYVVRDRADARAQGEVLEESPSIAAWTGACRGAGCIVAAGLIERADPYCYNTAVLVGPVGLIGSYRKAHLFGPEKRWCQPGDTGFPVFELPLRQAHDTAWTRVGLLICFDLRFPEAPRTLMLRGAEIVCVPTTWTDLHKPQPFDEHGRPMANYLALAHAYTNRMYVACADRVGTEAGVTFLGSSLIVGPTGQVLAGPASRDQEEMLFADVDPALARDKRLGDDNDLIADRRPGLYELDTTAQLDRAFS